jgi:hypothetical protein
MNLVSLKFGCTAAALVTAAAIGGCAYDEYGRPVASTDRPVVTSDRPMVPGDTVYTRELPSPVLRTIAKKFPGAEIYGVERERVAGLPGYEVRLRDRDGRYDARITEDGVLHEVDRRGS